jgi:acetyl-CoA carboxylase carboxyl transferase subunit beta
MNSNERIESLIDSNTWRPLYETVSPCDPLTFKDQKSYPERLKEAQQGFTRCCSNRGQV